MTPPEPTAALLHAKRRHGTTHAGLFSFAATITATQPPTHPSTLLYLASGFLSPYLAVAYTSLG